MNTNIRFPFAIRLGFSRGLTRGHTAHYLEIIGLEPSDPLAANPPRKPRHVAGRRRVDQTRAEP